MCAFIHRVGGGAFLNFEASKRDWVREAIMDEERMQEVASGQAWRRGRWLASDAEPVVLQSAAHPQGHAAMLVGVRDGERIVVLVAQALAAEHAYRVTGWTAAAGHRDAMGEMDAVGTWFELESCMPGRRAGEQRLGHYVGVLRRVGRKAEGGRGRS
ncbi:hypothetical protein [Thiomonas sp. FB-Cd]|uniref:hypothetical protein n=1 Tax=Thiomonas sp. FB-Cd TaxID=1158292 RepID=UPI0012DE994A|nr:hypothetical protein [Thiomonas sp. FB-Cd]